MPYKGFQHQTIAVILLGVDCFVDIRLKLKTMEFCGLFDITDKVFVSTDVNGLSIQLVRRYVISSR
jgi:hypothetical protein